MEIKIIELLEELLEKQESYYTTLPEGYERAKAKGKIEGLEMAFLRIIDLIEKQ